MAKEIILLNPVKQQEKEPLYEAELEQVLLGHMLAKPELVSRYYFLDSTDFYEQIHQEIHKKIKSDYDYGLEPSAITLTPFFRNNPLFEGLITENVNYLSKLMALTTEVTPLKPIAKLIKELSLKRQIEAEGFEIPRNLTARELSTKFSEMAELLISREFEIKATLTINEEIILDLAKPLNLISTGVKPLDEVMIGGIQHNALICFAGESKRGKTTMLQTISHNMNKLGHKHVYIACEMGATEIHKRNIARDLGYNSKDFIRKRGDMVFKDQVKRYQGDNNTFYVDFPGKKFSELKALMRNSLKYEIKGFFLDYLQLIQSDDPRKTDASHIFDVAQWIANFCKIHDVFCITAAQLNRQGDIYGSDGIDKAADMVIHMHRKDEANARGIWLNIKRSRYTETRSIGDEDTQELILDDEVGPHIREIT